MKRIIRDYGIFDSGIVKCLLNSVELDKLNLDTFQQFFVNILYCK